jgi:hypothetical protein
MRDPAWNFIALKIPIEMEVAKMKGSCRPAYQLRTESGAQAMSPNHIAH